MPKLLKSTPPEQTFRQWHTLNTFPFMNKPFTVGFMFRDNATRSCKPIKCCMS